MPLGVLPEAGNVTDVVARREAALAKCEVYLCGPPPMVDAALLFLEQQGVPDDQVFHDSFTSPVTVVRPEHLHAHPRIIHTNNGVD